MWEYSNVFADMLLQLRQGIEYRVWSHLLHCFGRIGPFSCTGLAWHGIVAWRGYVQRHPETGAARVVGMQARTAIGQVGQLHKQNAFTLAANLFQCPVQHQRAGCAALLIMQGFRAQLCRQQIEFVQTPFSGSPRMRGVVAGQMRMGQINIPYLGLIEPLQRCGRVGSRCNRRFRHCRNLQLLA